MATKEKAKDQAELKREEELKKIEKAIQLYSPEDLVEIAPLFYDAEKYTASVSVIVNGKAWLIPRGVSGIKVPRAVAEVLEHSEYQKQMANRYIREHEGIKNLGEF